MKHDEALQGDGVNQIGDGLLSFPHHVHPYAEALDPTNRDG